MKESLPKTRRWPLSIGGSRPSAAGDAAAAGGLFQLLDGLPRWAPLALLAMGVAMTTVVSCWEVARVAETDAHRVEVLTQRIHSEMQEELQHKHAGLTALRAVFIGSTSVTRKEFRQLAAAPELKESFNGALAVGFVRSIPGDEVAEFIKSARKDSVANFEIRHASPQPSEFDPSGTLSVVEFVEPAAVAPAWLGEDLGRFPAFRTAAVAAQNSGEAKLSAPVMLPTPTGQRAVAFYLNPVYCHGAPTTTPQQRYNALIGWVVLPLATDAIFADVDRATDGELDFAVYAGQPLLTSTPIATDVPVSEVRTLHTHPRAVVLAIRAGGQEWSVVLAPSPTFHAEGTLMVWVSALGGVGLSVLGSLLLFSLSTALRRAEGLAELMTADLRRLAEERNQLAMVAERTTNSVIITDTQRRIVWVNEGFTRTTGFTLAEAHGKSPGQLLQFDGTDPGVALAMSEAVRADIGFKGRIRNRAKDGRTFWNEINIQPLRDERGTLTGFMAVETDVTEAVEKSILLANSEARFRGLVESAEVVVFEFDQDANRFTYVSPFAERFGFPIEAWYAPGFWQERLHPEDRAAACDFCAAQVQAERAHRFTYRFIAADGRVVWIEDFVSRPDRTTGSTIVRGVMADITKQIETTQAIAQLTHRLETAIDGTSDGLWDWEDVDASAMWWSPRCYTMLGYADNEVPPTIESFFDLLHPDHREPTAAAIQEAIAGLRPYDVEVPLLQKDGSYRWCRSKAKVTFDAAGVGHRMAGSVQDIHDRKLTEEALRRSEERWSFALDGSGDGVWDWNIPSSEVSFSDRWKQMLGYEPHEIGHAVSEWSDRVHPDDKAQVLVDVQRHMSGETPTYSNEHRLRCNDGSWIWILARGMIVSRAADGSPLRMVGTHTDISERKQLELDLAQNAELLTHHANLVAAANDSFEEAQSVARIGSWTFDLSTGKVEWSKQTFRLFGRDEGGSPPDYAGVLSDYAPPDAARLDEAVRAAIQHGTPYSIVMRTSRGFNGIRWVRGEGRARFDSDGKVVGLFGTAMDVTEAVEREEALRAATKLAESANRSKSEFLANMSHEIRTPMTAILGFAELLADDSDRSTSPQQRREYSDTIRRNGEHLLSIINDILDLSKIEAGKMTVENVATNTRQIIDDVLSLMSVKAHAKGLYLSAVYDTAIPVTFHCDPVRLRQILVNLVGNAIKFTEVGGVTIHTSFKGGQASMVCFDVVDTGIGLTPEQSSRLFGAFEQADTSTTRKFGGTGLGLQISRRLSHMLGGEITFRSTPGGGSTFTLQVASGPSALLELALPSATRSGDPIGPSKPVSAAQEPVTVSTGEPLLGKRVILAEDGPDNQRLLSFYLRKAGAEVAVVSNGLLLVEAFCKNQKSHAPLVSPPPFDLVITDVQMPELDGCEASRILRSKGCSVPIVALTANAMSGTAESCIAAGCNSYLSKPVDRNELIEVCRVAIAETARQQLATTDTTR